MTAKIITAAAVVLVTAGAVLTYKHQTQPQQPSIQRDKAAVVPVEHEPLITFQNPAAVVSGTREVAANPVEIPKVQTADAAANIDVTEIEAEPVPAPQIAEIPVKNNTETLDNGSYDYFLFTSFSQSEETRTLVLAKITDAGIELKDIDVNPFARYRWEESLGVFDGILYSIKYGDLLSMNLSVPTSSAFETTVFNRQSEYAYLNGRLYGYVEKDKKRIYRVLDLKAKAYRDVTPVDEDLSYPYGPNPPLAVSPDQKKLAFFVEDPNGIVLTVLEIDSGEISQADQPTKLMVPIIASGNELPSLVWLDTEKLLTIRTEQTANPVNILICFDMTTGQMKDILALPGNPVIRFAPHLIQDYAAPGPRVCIRDSTLGEYRLDMVSGKLVENDWINGAYYFTDGYLFHNERELGPVKSRDYLKVSPDGRRAIWISDGRLMFHDSGTNIIQIITEVNETYGKLLLWLTEENLTPAAANKNVPQGWIAFPNYSQAVQLPELPSRQDSRRPTSKSLRLEIETDKTEYQRHEPIETTLTLTNISSDDIHILHPVVVDSVFHRIVELRLHYPGGIRLIDVGAGPYGSQEEEILIKAGDSISVTELLEVSKTGQYELECRFKGVKDDRYRGDLAAEPVAFRVNAVADAQEENRLFENKVNRLIETFYWEMELASEWNGANNTVGDVLLGLPGMGSGVVPYLIEVLNDEQRENARNLLFRALTATADEQSLPFFRQCLSRGESEPVCEWLFDLYYQKRSAGEAAAEPLDVLLGGMEHQDSAVRRDVSIELARVYDPRVTRCFESAVDDEDQEVQTNAVRYLAATEWLDLTDWLALACEQTTYPRYLAACSIIKDLEKRWNTTKGVIPVLSNDDIVNHRENLKVFTDTISKWHEWAIENPRFSFHFFDDARKDWIADELAESENSIK